MPPAPPAGALGLVAANARSRNSMPDKPIDHGHTFVVTEYQDDGLWHEVLTTKDEVKANELLKTLGDRGELETVPAAAVETVLKPPTLYQV